MSDNTEYRLVIRFFTFLGTSTQTIYEEISGVFGEECPSHDCQKKEFKPLRPDYYINIIVFSNN